MKTSKPESQRGDRFYVPDEKHKEYINNTLFRARTGTPSSKTNTGLPRITEDDEALIREFLSEIQATGSLTQKRVYKYCYILVGWRGYIGEFRTNSMADLFAGINAIQTAKTHDGSSRYAKHTLADFIGFLKRFYLWMQENGYTPIEAKKINKIKAPSVPLMTKTAEMLLTEEDVRKLIEACQCTRDRAIIAMMYEGGFRIGEIASLRWKQLKFNDWNVAVNVDNKTQKPRYVPLVMARPYLAQWKNDYPLQIDEDGFVFLTAGKHEQLQYGGFTKQLEKIAKRAGVTRKVTPHIFRHSRITHLIQKGFGESKIKLMMWGSIDSDMFQAYAHLTNSDIEQEVAREAGIIIPENQVHSDALEPRQCCRCYTINSPTQQFCGQCGLPLTQEAQDQFESINTLLNNFCQTPAGRNMLIKTMQQQNTLEQHG
jgi:site-specific recombinase XerD